MAVYPLLQQFILIALSLLASSCILHSSPTAPKLGARGEFSRNIYAAPDYDIVAYTRFASGPDLTVYVEGDGRAWLTRTRPSSDPTPHPPLALALAAQDPTPNVLYLARPCQFTAGSPHFRDCNRRDWTSGRMSEAIVRNMNDVLEQAKAHTAAQRIHIVGYSGGAGVAVLIAARRSDVASIRTIAGNLNTDLWARLHSVTPLSDSLHPEDYAWAVRHIPQTHYVGSEDTNIPPTIAHAFVKASSGDPTDVKVIPNCTHSQGWEEQWPRLVREFR